MGATGGVAPYSWSLHRATLPHRSHLDAYGAITGTAQATGTFTASVLITDSAKTPATATQSLVIRINPPTALTISVPTLAGGTVGTAYPPTNLTSAGGVTPVTWSVSSGALPPGLVLDPSSGMLSGTPIQAGTYPITITAHDSESPRVERRYEESIVVVPTSTSTTLVASLATAVDGQADTLTATVTSPIQPDGTVTFSDNGSPIPGCQSQGLSYGTPYIALCTVSYAASGSHLLGASYSGGASTSSSTASAVTVASEINPLTLATTSVPPAMAGTEYPGSALSATGGVTPFTWAVTSGTLPPGMTLDASSGDLAGLPTVAGGIPSLSQ